MESLHHGLITVVQSGAPGMQQEGQAQLPGCVALQGLLDGHKVLQGLGHLAALDGQVSCVQEVVHPLVAAEASLTKEFESSAS